MVEEPLDRQRGRGLDLHLVADERNRAAVVLGATLNRALVAHGETEARRMGERGAHRIIDGDGAVEGRKLNGARTAAVPTRERVAVGEVAVDEGAQLGGLLGHRLGVAVADLHAELGVAHHEEVGCELDGQLHRGHYVTAGGKLTRILHELRERNLGVGVDPARSVIGLAHGRHFGLLDAEGLAHHHGTVGAERTHGSEEVLVVAALNDEHLAGEAGRRVGDGHHRTVGLGQIVQEVRTTLVRREDDEVALGGRAVVEDGEVGTAPVAHAADDAREHGGGLLFHRGRSRGEDHRQHGKLVRGGVDERRGEGREIVGEPDALLDEREAAFGRDVKPDGGIGRIFTDRRRVSDELDRQLIDGLDHLGRKLERELRGLAHHRGRDGHRALQAAVEVEVDLRAGRGERGRRRKAQVERRLRDNLVTAHAEVEGLHTGEACKLDGRGTAAGHELHEGNDFGTRARDVCAPDGLELRDGLHAVRGRAPGGSGERSGHEARGSGSDECGILHVFLVCVCHQDFLATGCRGSMERTASRTAGRTRPGRNSIMER